MKWWGTHKAEPGPEPAAEPSVLTNDEPWLHETRALERDLLHQCRADFGDSVCHVFDRGFAGQPWLQELQAVPSRPSRFIMRFPKRYQFRNRDGFEFRRWQIEMSLRFNKSELALESPRLWSWERRLKLLMMVTLVYSLLLRLVKLGPQWVQNLLRRWCPRTGKRSRETPTPLYRLREALMHLFNNHPPPWI
jgi:hypothetical protein